MHPAPSIIVFTVFSGLGLGLLAFLGLGAPAAGGWDALALFVLAYGCTLGGLAASTLHLGRRDRVFKALRQWRTSWMSREGVLMGAALLVLGAYAGMLILAGVRVDGLGWVGAALAMVTVLATAMIYTQLKTVPRWNHWLTPVLFALQSLAGGAILSGQRGLAVVLLLALGGVQALWWRAGDGRFRASGTDTGTATGLGGIGMVRLLAPPHSGPNYISREMVHLVARKHARRLRFLGLLLLSPVPALLLMLPIGLASALFSALTHVAGALVCRWLFFAEAEHVVGVFHGQ